MSEQNCSLPFSASAESGTDAVLAAPADVEPPPFELLDPHAANTGHSAATATAGAQARKVIALLQETTGSTLARIGSKPSCCESDVQAWIWMKPVPERSTNGQKPESPALAERL